MGRKSHTIDYLPFIPVLMTPAKMTFKTNYAEVNDVDKLDTKITYTNYSIIGVTASDEDINCVSCSFCGITAEIHVF